MSDVAVILSGCGYLDGAEIRESVLTLLYLDEQGANVTVFAPDIDQHHVVNHLTGEESAGESRNVMVESARIARGAVKPLSDLNADAFDALLIPGGFGVAKNLSDFAFNGTESSLEASFDSAIRAFYEQGKPIGAICIAPAVLARALKGSGVTLTIGEDEATASAIESLGCAHESAPSSGVVVDDKHCVASCSAYMREDGLSDIAKGIEQVVTATLKMAANVKMAS